MPKQSNQKARILFVRDYLLENTDVNNTTTTTEICAYLKHQGISADSRTVLDDIKTLIDYGLDIEGERKYYIASREINLPELKLLMDSVLTSKFVTEKKTEQLISKLTHLCSRHEAKEIQGKVYCNRIKSMNESIHFNLSEIHEAIQSRNRITFKYLQYTLQKDMIPRRDGKIYEVFPIALIYNESNYYLLATESSYKNDIIKHYRVDKMKNVTMLGLPVWRRGAIPHNIDLSEYTKQNFSMYGGGTERVTMQFPNSLIGVVIDRFGKDIVISKVDEDYFKINVPVAISHQFFGWIFGLGSEVKIIEPKHIAKKYKKMLKDVFDMYVAKRSYYT